MSQDAEGAQLDAVEEAIWESLETGVRESWESLRQRRVDEATWLSRLGCRILGHSRTKHPGASALAAKCEPFCWTCGKAMEEREQCR